MDSERTSAGDRGWRIANGIMGVLFVFSAAVQVNDPDPVLWVAIYLLAAVICGLAMRGAAGVWLSGLVALVAVLWATRILPRVFGIVPFLDMFGAWEMRDIGIEESREMYGLFIVAAWMTVLTVRTLVRRARRRPGHERIT